LYINQDIKQIINVIPPIARNTILKMLSSCFALVKLAIKKIMPQKVKTVASIKYDLSVPMTHKTF